MQFDEDVIELCNLPSDYNGVHEFPEHLTTQTAYSYWPHIPFILERLINVYILTYNRKVAFVL